MLSLTRLVSRRIAISAAAVLFLLACTSSASAQQTAEVDTGPTPLTSGVRAVIGVPTSVLQGDDETVTRFLGRQLGSDTELVFLQVADSATAARLRSVAHQMQRLGRNLFIDAGPLRTIHLASNLVDRVVILSEGKDGPAEQEVMRVLRPGGVAMIGGRQHTKTPPEGVDHWTHPYHGPDNNPQSTDRLARAPYHTQFLAGPLFSPMPEVTVAANGRIFKAHGHIAHKANQNAMLNTLVCINAYNGAELWRRPLHPGFMIHRNTMIATQDTLYLADDQSCKLIDAATGSTRREIVIKQGLADGKVWKWMAMQNGVLFALIGGEEIRVDTMKSSVRGLGHWPWGMWKGHDYSDPSTSFGFGRTLVAIDPTSGEILWKHGQPEYIDSRGVCMEGNRLFFYSPHKQLACLDIRTGNVLWKNSDQDLMAALGNDGRAQHYVTGYATTTYIKSGYDRLFFAGPQRTKMVVASAEDGRLLWDNEDGNLQLVLREDGIYAAGPGSTGARFSYDGKILNSLPIRRACTRATGSIDSVFYRTSGGTVRVETASNRASHIAPMRPPCQDGVLVSEGMLYWGPWMCGCQLSLYGHICLTPADGSLPAADEQSALLVESAGSKDVAPLAVNSGDWLAYRHDSARSSTTEVAAAAGYQKKWSASVSAHALPTAPIIAANRVFLADRTGMVRSLSDKGKTLWATAVGGAVFFAPTLADGRLYVGAADGRVYALEAVTGRILWSAQIAPTSRWMPVYGKLMSTWPVAGGVAVKDGILYAAAGIAHYDGTYVVALDAVTGSEKWRNDSSGQLSADVDCGISLQGNLSIKGNELQFAGGGGFRVARYDLATGKCLNIPRGQVTSQFATAFYAYFPDYDKYSSLVRNFPNGRTLNYQASYDGVRFTPLAMLSPDTVTRKRGPGATDRAPGVKTDRARPARPQRIAVWQHKPGPRYTSLVLAGDTLVAAGHAPTDASRASLSVISVEDGKVRWLDSLPAVAVKNGIAIDHRKHMVVTLENGQIVYYTPN